MKEQIEKQAIEEMAYSVCRLENKPENCASCMWKASCENYLSAENYYTAGYRKQVWISVEERCPDDSDKLVLVCVSGTVGKHRNINLKVAYELATYNQEEGWILENYPEDMDVTVHAWLPLPEPPKMKGY